jgi:hypothetical protein
MLVDAIKRSGSLPCVSLSKTALIAVERVYEGVRAV